MVRMQSEFTCTNTSQFFFMKSAQQTARSDQRDCKNVRSIDDVRGAKRNTTQRY